MSFRAVLGDNSRPLSGSDGRVLHVLLTERGASQLTAAQVAQHAGAHESTVVRLAQKLGYRGYAELRADLARDERGPGADGTGAPAARDTAVMRATSGSDLASLASDEAEALAAMARHLPQAAVDAAARALHDAQRIYLFTSVGAREAVDLLARRLRRLGKVVVPVGPTAREIAEGFVTFDGACLLVAFALREVPTALPALIGTAHARGGTVVMITDSPAHAFEPAPDHVLAAGRGRDSEYATLLVPMAIVYALQLAVHHLDRDHYLAVRESIDDLTRLMGGRGEVPLQRA